MANHSVIAFSKLLHSVKNGCLSISDYDYPIDGAEDNIKILNKAAKSHNLGALTVLPKDNTQTVISASGDIAQVLLIFNQEGGNYVYNLIEQKFELILEYTMLRNTKAPLHCVTLDAMFDVKNAFKRKDKMESSGLYNDETITKLMEYLAVIGTHFADIPALKTETYSK